MNLIAVIVICLVIGWLGYRATKLGYFSKKETAAPLSTPRSPAGHYTGRVDAPPQDVRLATRARQLADGGPLGGGVDGGIYLEGAFNFTVLDNGRMSGEFILHGTPSQITGVVNPDFTFSGTHEGGPFEGKVTGTSITGQVHEGGGREWVYGDMVGNYQAA
jgi:hypothetical protein